MVRWRPDRAAFGDCAGFVGAGAPHPGCLATQQDIAASLRRVLVCPGRNLDPRGQRQVVPAVISRRAL